MQSTIQSANRLPQTDRSKGLTRLAAGLTRLSPGQRVKTHIKAGPNGCSGCGKVS